MEDIKEKTADERERILKELYNCDIDAMCWFPVPATAISKFSKISLYKTRKILHKLKDEGLVRFERGYLPDRYSYEGELLDEGFFYCGWELTDKGRENDTYISLKNKYSEYMKRNYEEINC